MPPSLFFSANFYGFHKKPSDLPLQDNISLSHAPLLQEQIVQDDRTRSTRNYWYPLCYFLHAFLVVIHLILLVVATSHHTERRVVMTYDQAEALMTPLSVGLQAFYILYTALLVFVTQRLALSAIFSSSRKLTHIHDLCGAWSGVGAALSALWQQTKVTSSILSIALVVLYFACISVLQITSSTLIELQISAGYPVTDMAAVVRTWPNASVDLGSLEWMVMAPLAPFLQDFFTWGTSGLINNTIYDYMGTDDLSTATVDAMTLNANCGLLTDLSIDVLEDNVWHVHSSMSDLDPIGILVFGPPLFNEIWFAPSIQCMGPMCSNFILSLVSTEMEVDDSVSGADHIYIDGTYYYSDGTTQNFSIPISFVACSLDATNQTITLDSSGNPVGSGNQPTDLLEWSSFSPGGDLNLTSAISHAIKTANSLPPSPYCQPIMSDLGSWAYISVFNAYMRSVLGMGVSPCDGSDIAQYTSTSSPLTRDQMESAVSQIAANFMWLAGQLGEAGGGFDPQELVTPISGIAELWSLNINTLPVVFALCASVVLLMLAFHILRRLPAAPIVVSGSSVLEIMWFGSRSQVLRDHLKFEETASLDSLRAWAMSKTVFWMHPANKDEKTSDVHPVVPFFDVETGSEGSKRLGLLGSENQQMSHRKFLRTWNILRCTSRRLCYMLHVVLVAIHVALLALLVHHPELSVVILGDSKTPIMIGLGAALQAVYTVYSALLIFLMQRLALSKIANERRKLTTVHDVSGAWTGIGAAVNVLWQQRIVSSSARDVFMVVTYLTMMLVLNITSSSIMQWRWHQNPALVGVNVQTNLAMPDDTVDISQLGWMDIFPIVRLIQDEELTTTGLFNNTIYDVAAQSSQRSAWEVAPVNATTLTAQCGLVSNLSLTYLEDGQVFQVSFQNGTDQGSFFVLPPIFENVIQAIPLMGCAACPQTQFYLLTTAIDLDGSVDDSVVVDLNWTFPGPIDIFTSDTPSLDVSAYIAACSLNAQTDLVSPEGVNQTLDQASSASTAWSVWSPEDATNLSVGMTTAFSTATLFSPKFTDMGSYLMSLLGMNVTFANETLTTLSDANPSVKLSPWQLENAIAQTAASFLWAAGLVGESGGGFQRSTGETQGLSNDTSPGWRLQLNTVPVIFAFVASSLSFILVVMIIGKGPSREHPSSVSGTSVLECLWLEAHSELLHAHLQTVEEPRLQTLRGAGMFEMCLGDIGWLSDVEADQSSLELGPRSVMSNVMLHVRGLSGGI